MGLSTVCTLALVYVDGPDVRLSLNQMRFFFCKTESQWSQNCYNGVEFLSLCTITLLTVLTALNIDLQFRQGYSVGPSKRSIVISAVCYISEAATA